MAPVPALYLVAALLALAEGLRVPRRAVLLSPAAAALAPSASAAAAQTSSSVAGGESVSIAKRT